MADQKEATPGGSASEVEALRAEVDRLRTELENREPSSEPPAETAGERTGWWRTLVVVVCLVLIGILAPLSVAARWARDEVSDTNRYVDTVAPLASDPGVQNAVINVITDQITSRVDVNSITQDVASALQSRGLPARAADALTALAGPLENGLHSFVQQAATKVVRSPQFATAWADANRQAHEQMVGLLTGQGHGAVKVNGTTVSVDLATIINTVKHLLVAQGFTLAEKIPTVHAQFTIMQSADLAKAQRAFRLLNTAAVALPIIALLLLGVALFVAKSRRRTLFAAGLVIAGGMLLLGVMLNAFRGIYLGAVPSDVLPPPAAATIYDTIVRFMRESLRAVLVLSLAVAIAAWLSGPSNTAVGARRGLRKGVTWVQSSSDRAGFDTGPFGQFLHTYRTPIRVAIISIALLVYVLAAHPTGAFTLVLVLVTVVVLLVVEALSRPPRSVEATSPST